MAMQNNIKINDNDDHEDEEKKQLKDGDEQHKKNNDENEPEWEPLLWTIKGELNVQCIAGCYEILKSDEYAGLSKTIYQIDGLPKKLNCYNYSECGNILEKKMLCFYCPIGIIKGSKHCGMVWCTDCILEQARELHEMRIRHYGIPPESAPFDGSVKISGFGTIDGLK